MKGGRSCHFVGIADADDLVADVVFLGDVGAHADVTECGADADDDVLGALVTGCSSC